MTEMVLFPVRWIILQEDATDYRERYVYMKVDKEEYFLGFKISLECNGIQSNLDFLQRTLPVCLNSQKI